MSKIFKSLSAVILVASIIVFSACKKSFDNPPGASDPNIVANTTIRNLKLLHTTAGAYDLISTNRIISGVVVANDKSGNLYKQLYIEDSTGGLQILLDATSLYATYPVGRRIYILCNGLTISDYNKNMQLGVRALVAGLPSMEGIPSTLISKYVIGGSLNNPVVPRTVTFAQLGGTGNTNMQDPYIGTLIKLDGYAFAVLSGTYSDTSVYKSTVNRDIKNCANQTLIVRTSAYSNFAGRAVAQGRGSLVAMYTVFNNTRQLILRNTDDVQFNDPYACPLPPGTLLSENFESIGANNLTLSVPGWKNIAEVGTVLYQNAVFGTTKAAKVSAFSTGVATATSWLISPAVNLTGATAPNLTFTSAAGFAVGTTNFRVYISTNYNGSNTPSSSTWIQLPATLASAPATGFSTFIPSGVINLSAYIGQTIYIGYRYDGGDPGKTTTFQIDDVKVMAL